MPAPASEPVHVIRPCRAWVVEVEGSASPVRRTGFTVATVGAELSTVTVGATMGPAGPLTSAASETWPALRYSPTVPLEQPVNVRAYSVPSSGPAATGVPRTQFGAVPVRVKSLFARPVTGPAKTSR